MPACSSVLAGRIGRLREQVCMIAASGVPDYLRFRLVVPGGRWDEFEQMLRAMSKYKIYPFLVLGGNDGSALVKGKRISVLEIPEGKLGQKMVDWINSRHSGRHPFTSVFLHTGLNYEELGGIVPMSLEGQFFPFDYQGVQIAEINRLSRMHYERARRF